jgi:hypothetical protein
MDMALNSRATPSRTAAVMDIIEEKPSKKQTGYVIPPSPQRNLRPTAANDDYPKYYERPTTA